jgi:hypothetical protein
MRPVSLASDQPNVSLHLAGDDCKEVVVAAAQGGIVVQPHRPG